MKDNDQINNDQYDFRFGGIGRLVGQKEWDLLKSSHVAVVGIGGVGSWVCESLARSGVGKITMIDLDDLCQSNINRQVHALSSSVGQMKTEVMKKRILEINPQCEIQEIQSFYSKKNSNEILSHRYDYIIDCIDSFEEKIQLILDCKEHDIPLIVCGGAGGRVDPTRIKIDDLSKSYNDKLLQRIRKKLRQDHGFSRNRNFKVPCVFSYERAVYPDPAGGTCHKPIQGESTRLDCQTGFGSASFVTGSFAFFAVSYVVSKITKNPIFN
ncbi:tRNA threonylcarbamoyladenosine dehydratase [Halobacteriovorax sp. GB3]|uniref:tRNA threonylcarbamoyladenosine dehydratase n=1 Tax=Halobacteriovorax sp. GB3 TaxID=2719615 RepID=UPI00235EDA73|nr:tRNA threonylcarbamoyladenosine dehydratase [Halobacteriovorax sp. GB3]MDD0852862.1 tRNA threonylcarbamoyladenosine dehydratase [Halobacteriovorax sp. GB3]